MKKYFLLLIFPVLFMACQDDSELNALKERVDELEGRLSEVEQAQQDALAAAIADLMTEIENLEASNDATAAEIAELLAELEALSVDVTNLEGDLDAESGKVYWGNVVSADDYAAITEGSYSIISGYVEASDDDHLAALAGIEVIGGYLNISGGSMADLALTTIGGDLMIMHTDLTSLTASNLTSVGGDMILSVNSLLATVDMAALKIVAGDLKVDGAYWNTDFNYQESAALTSLSMTNLIATGGDMTIEWIGMAEMAFDMVTEVGGSLTVAENRSTAEISFAALTSVDGDLSITNAVVLEAVNFDALVTIGDDFLFSGNGEAGFGIGGGGDPTGISVLDDFAALTTLGGNLEISNNSQLTQIIGFDALTDFDGDIRLDWNQILYNVEGFNSVTIAGMVSIDGIENYDNALSVDAFNAITNLNDGFVLNTYTEVADVTVFAEVTQGGYILMGSQWAPLNLTGTFTGFEKMTNCYDTYSAWIGGVNVYASVLVYFTADAAQWCSFKSLVDVKNGSSPWGVSGDIIFMEDGVQVDEVAAVGSCSSGS